MSSRIVPITLDRPRTLKFSFNAFADMQDADPRIFQKSVFSLPVIRRYLCAGLKHEDSQITEVRAGEILETYLENGGILDDLITKVMDAANNSTFANRKKQADTTVPEEVELSKNSVVTGSSPSNQ